MKPWRERNDQKWLLHAGYNVTSKSEEVFGNNGMKTRILRRLKHSSMKRARSGPNQGTME